MTKRERKYLQEQKGRKLQKWLDKNSTLKGWMPYEEAMAYKEWLEYIKPIVTRAQYHAIWGK